MLYRVDTFKHLIGRLFTRGGVKYMIVKCEGATVVAAYRAGNKVRRMLVPLSTALDALDSTEIEVTEAEVQSRAEDAGS